MPTGNTQHSYTVLERQELTGEEAKPKSVMGGLPMGAGLPRLGTGEGLEGKGEPRRVWGRADGEGVGVLMGVVEGVLTGFGLCAIETTFLAVTVLVPKAWLAAAIKTLVGKSLT